jgi:hypothetical protein
VGFFIRFFAQALGLFDEQSVEEVNDMLQEIEERHAETDDAQAEKYEVLDQLLEQAQAYPDGQASAGGDDDDDGEELDLESVQRTEELLYSLREQWDNLDADNRFFFVLTKKNGFLPHLRVLSLSHTPS